MQNPLEIENGEIIPAKQKSIPWKEPEKKQGKRNLKEAITRQEIKMLPHASY